MKLYQSDTSPNSRRVRIFLAEKGISMPIVPVDLATKEQFGRRHYGRYHRQLCDQGSRPSDHGRTCRIEALV